MINNQDKTLSAVEHDESAHKRRSMSTARPGGFIRTFGLEEDKFRRSLEIKFVESISNSGEISHEESYTQILYQNLRTNGCQLQGSETRLVNTSLAHLTTTEWLSGIFSKEWMDETGKKLWEAMPLYARIGMHLIFHGPCAIRFITWSRIQNILKRESIREGEIYDSTDPPLVLHQITSFIATYNIRLDELLEPDISKYLSFNSFFSRRLKPDARPPAFPDDPSIVSSAADSRLTVFNSVDEATKFWIKGKAFTIDTLIQDKKVTASLGKNPRLAIWRLAPQDYHRFHSPITGKFIRVNHIPGEYYTVNPQAINENLNVFTVNTRSVAIFDTIFSHDKTKTFPFVLIAVGALLVGSIKWDKNPGDNVIRGGPLGYFQYGGSTVIGVFPQEAKIKWDDDLAEASRTSLEVLIKAGERIGKAEGET
ncbi:hypothetical protein Clacol_000258 [Clathrus columnatus]|uniref:phosphatidylserine decarboxylase n=1 Tax=Clathrus columnatus TaxID=1419009 RepID=A0AAV5A075_9AGAM|nr:hypothetical protein Clacol_000258 [Clathrus columnatus]